MSALNRRGFLTGAGILAAGLGMGTAHAQSSSGRETGSSGSSGTEGAPVAADLRFRPDGKFRVVQFNDTQDSHLTDRRTIEFMGLVLDRERPDFALINGDVIASGPTTDEQVYQALNNVVRPMEDRSVPWAITFGNHDEDPNEEPGVNVSRPDMVEFVRRYRHNLNSPAETGGYGNSNVHLVIGDSAAGDPRFALWLLDSGSYLPDEVAGQSKEDLPGYDYIRPQQIEWYRGESLRTERACGHRVDSLMYFHIPTFEHRDMWFGGPGKDGLVAHGRAERRHGIEGVKKEDVYHGSFNSGIYSAVVERGDVRGIYCGHDHINSFRGNFFGVELGYCPGTGFGTYGLMDGTWAMHTMRGARVFDLDENADGVYTGTRLVFAKDLGVDMNPAGQPIEEPEAFPDYVR